MKVAEQRFLASLPVFRSGLAVTVLLSGVVGANVARADDDGVDFRPGNLLLSRSVYDNNPANIAVGTQLPPNCVAPNCVTATADGSYPFIWDNSLVDGSFGITAKIVLDQLKPSGELVNSLEVPNSADGIPPTRDQMVTSFPSKSEIALNLSTDGRVVTFMGYLAPIDALDVSNSNTPAVFDPTNPVSGSYSRVVAEVDEHGRFRFTKTNAYSGNNGRVAIRNDKDDANIVYMSGNAGNGANPQPNGVIVGAGLQILTEERTKLAAQNPGQPTPVGSFNITQLGLTADKIGKDTNFRGLSIFNKVIYTTKGSGGNGINAVYFIDTTGFDSNGKPLACSNGVGIPGATAALPTTPIFYDATQLQTKGVVPYNMCVLAGFPTNLAKKTTSFPFGVWFADAKTLYVTDEGNGTTTFDPVSGKYTAAAAQTGAGLQKWVFDASLGAWKLAYVLQAGLNLGVPYTVTGYPTGQNPKTGLPWSPASDGLRNLMGRVNHDGTATIWAITSTVSGNGDQGADPNQLVMIRDNLAATSLPAGEAFTALRTARFGEVLRGILFTPGTDRDHLADDDDHEHDHDGHDHDRHADAD
ncbi:hypothetical protein SAMN05444159_1394 [Bradyrhizobium lablabi]|uniref:Uncharacterized protein n=1 Tax=Bradyrhizobium lablabi TaxID=722472 RepID=A0A1M6LVJ2_9BRAD|nr:hypothetical protein [Bradyrhizobium lablabi]SHJ75162.1 hypothetical protein SAMN05444159_1394 [Bradyrhizobium lablabi]